MRVLFSLLLLYSLAAIVYLVITLSPNIVLWDKLTGIIACAGTAYAAVKLLKYTNS